MMTELHTTENQRGFTLIEVMIALTVLAIGILGLSIIFPATTRDVGKSGVMTKALELAQEKIEEMHALAYDDPDLDTTYEHEDSANPIDGVFVRTWEVYDDQPVSGCKRVAVEVTWNTYAQGSVNLWSVIASAGR